LYRCWVLGVFGCFWLVGCAEEFANVAYENLVASGRDGFLLYCKLWIVFLKCEVMGVTLPVVVGFYFLVPFELLRVFSPNSCGTSALVLTPPPQVLRALNGRSLEWKAIRVHLSVSCREYQGLLEELRSVEAFVEEVPKPLCKLFGIVTVSSSRVGESMIVCNQFWASAWELVCTVLVIPLRTMAVSLCSYSYVMWCEWPVGRRGWRGRVQTSFRLQRNNGSSSNIFKWLVNALLFYAFMWNAVNWLHLKCRLIWGLIAQAKNRNYVFKNICLLLKYVLCDFFFTVVYFVTFLEAS